MRNGMVEYPDGHKEWFIEGKLHRLDGPAIIYSNGDKCWYKEDKLHREDGPAIEYINGTKAWFIEGVRHREDGPALIYSDGDKVWYWIGDVVYSDNIDRTNKLNLSTEMKKSIIKYKLERM